MALPVNCTAAGRRLDRPDFEADQVGLLGNAVALSPVVKAKLAALLPKRWDKAQQARFLSQVEQSLAQAAWFHNETPSARQLREIALLENRARQLLIAIAGLSSDSRTAIRRSWQAAAFGAAAPAQLSDDGAAMGSAGRAQLFGWLWDVVQDLETVAADVPSEITPAKTARPRLANARRLTTLVAQSFYVEKGRLPPCDKDAWFPRFMNALGTSVKYKTGVALVASVVATMKRSGKFSPSPSQKK